MSYPIAYCGCDILCDFCGRYRANCNTSLCKKCEREVEQERKNCDHKMEKYHDGYLNIYYMRCKKMCGHSYEVAK